MFEEYVFFNTNDSLNLKGSGMMCDFNIINTFVKGSATSCKLEISYDIKQTIDSAFLWAPSPVQPVAPRHAPPGHH